MINNSAHVHIWLPLEKKENANSLVELARSKILKTGTVGHVALELHIEKNEYTTDLVDRYLTGTKIPHELILLPNLFNSQNEKQYYRIYWSFYSGALTDSPHSYGHYFGDCMDKYNHRSVNQNQKYAEYFRNGSKYIQPNFIKFFESIPYLNNVMKIPMIKPIMRFFGLDNFPGTYHKKLGIKEIVHTTYLKSKEDALFQAIEEMENKQSELKKNNQALNITEFDQLQLCEMDKKIDEIKDMIIFERNNATSKGGTPDHMYTFPITISNLTDGLNIELILKKMREIEDQESMFDLYGLNCSETVLQILASGESTAMPSVFDRRGFIFKLANPYSVHDLCKQYAQKTELISPSYLKIKGDADRREPARKKIKWDLNKECRTIKTECPSKALTQLTRRLHNNNDIIPCLAPNTLSEMDNILKDDNADFASLIYTSKNETKMVSLKEALSYSQTLTKDRIDTVKKRKRSREVFNAG